MWKCEMENVMIWGKLWVHHETDKNLMNSLQLIPTHTKIKIDKQKIKTNWADERIEDMEWIMNDKQTRSKFQGVSPVERS